jgi:hypothetical protein
MSQEPRDAPGATELPAVGARVRCQGLTGAAELNGCLGRVVSHDGARAKVRISDGAGGRVLSVKPQNLVVVVAGGGWETQAEDPDTLFQLLGPDVVQQNAAEGRGLHSPTSQFNLSRF